MTVADNSQRKLEPSRLGATVSTMRAGMIRAGLRRTRGRIAARQNADLAVCRTVDRQASP